MNLFEEFKTRAEAVQAEVHRVPSKAAALEFVLQFLRREEVSETPGQYAVWAKCPMLEGADTALLSGETPGLRFDVTRELAANARIGISQMECAAAGTGTLLQDATEVEKRLVSTLPIIHVALVETDRILPDIGSALTKFSPANRGYISMITGPSRTADIERVLTIGVHGPERLVIVCVDNTEGAGR